MAVCICKSVFMRLARVPLRQVAAVTSVSFPQHTQTLSLSPPLRSPVSVTLDSTMLEIHSSYRMATPRGCLTQSACAYAKTPTRARRNGAVVWLDYTSWAAQPDRGTSTKTETRKEYKRLICSCCISMFHLPTLAYPHPHRLDPITTARTLSCNTNISSVKEYCCRVLFHNLFPLHPHMHMGGGGGGKKGELVKENEKRRGEEGGGEEEREVFMRARR